MKQHIINKQNNFIAGWYLPNKELCKNLINLFEKSNNKFEEHLVIKELINQKKIPQIFHLILFQKNL